MSSKHEAHSTVGGDVCDETEGQDEALHQRIVNSLTAHCGKAAVNLEWLYANLHPYFFITMKEEIDAIVALASFLQGIVKNRQIILTDQPKKYMVARLDLPGSLYDTLKGLQEQEISYAEMIHSYGPIPGAENNLEIQRYEFDRKSHDDIVMGGDVKIDRETRISVSSFLKDLYPEFDFDQFDDDLHLLWLNNESYFRISPPERIARILWLYQQGKAHDGLYLDVEKKKNVTHHWESRLLFSVEDPPPKGFLTQVSEVFQRLRIGVRRSYSLNINTGVNVCFLSTFYVTTFDGQLIKKKSDLFRRLQAELYNTQILSTSRSTYKDFVANHIMTGEEASLTNALVAFCHTSLAHNQPDRFDLETVKSAFQSDPEITLQIIDVFKKRFTPALQKRKADYKKAIQQTEQIIEGYNTGHRYLDEIRRTIFRTCLSFINHTLKTNFFVPEKHALSFRLDPAYLNDLGPEFTSELPPEIPFRITFFFGRYGVGYHIGFSDIARGGWRTIVSTSHDEHTTYTNTLFREVYVLAHTQHLKNKDIYEGGSKLTAVVDASGLDSPEEVTQRLHKLQYGFTNAFLDIFVTVNGKVKNSNVVDYYGEDEAIELGPDENMHDSMIELIAKQALKRGYILGVGIMSSKRVGINHKEYGVTSRGLIKFAEIAMKELGVDTRRDPFIVKITGGTNGDVAGNAIRLLLERCPRVKIRSIAAGTGALYDPVGADPKELRRLVLKEDIVDFNPNTLHHGGYILFRYQRKKDGLRELHRKLVRTDSGISEQWITADEFYREFDNLIFSVQADLFLPCGGRPETIDGNNWQELFTINETPTAKVICEGANSYITPEARTEIQEMGVVVLRDASANKCGVISSSYEIIANLLLKEKEFRKQKETYVEDVLSVLDKRAEDEANLIFKRHREADEKRLYTEISIAISREINEHYARLFAFFSEHPELADRLLYRKVILNHLPALIGKQPKYRARIRQLPPKIKYAIMASEIASYIVYHGGWEVDFESRLDGFVKKAFS